MSEVFNTQERTCWFSRDKLYWFLKYSHATSCIRQSTYPTKTVIDNPVLACFNLLGKVALLAYLLFTFFHYSLYYRLSIPKVHVNYWVARNLDPSYEEDNFIYCNNDSYDFVYSKTWQYTNNECTSLEWSESYIKGESNFFFFTTYYEEIIRAISRNCTSNDEIFLHRRPSYEDCRFKLFGPDTICECEFRQNYFVTAAEYWVFAFSLSYYVPDIHMGGTSGDSDFRLAILGPNGNTYKKVANDNMYVSMTVKEYLRAAGINLDTLNTRAERNGSMPHYRITGVTLIISVQLYNMPVYHGFNEWSSKTVGLLQVRPEPGWSSMGSSLTYHSYPIIEKYYTDRYRYGVKFIFHDGGYIGTFDRSAITGYFITSVVLFAVIPIVVGKLGILMFGFTSKIYKEQLKRHPDGIIRDMQHFLDTFNYLFNDYDKYRRSKMFGKTADWCCCRALWRYCNQKKETISKEEWTSFCRKREISAEQELQMWCEINSNPYLLLKKSFDSKTLWNAVRKNYDKVSGRLDTLEYKTCIREKWEAWEAECNSVNKRRSELVNLPGTGVTVVRDCPPAVVVEKTWELQLKQCVTEQDTLISEGESDEEVEVIEQTPTKTSSQ